MSIIASIAELVDLQKDRIDSITYLKIMNFLKEKYDEKKTFNKNLDKTIEEEEEEEEEEETMIFYNNEDEDTYASLYK